jgi:hypothetical protein
MFRLLVVANRTSPCPALLAAIVERIRIEDEHEVRLIAPALNSRLRHLMSDVDAAILAAELQVEQALRCLRDADVTVTGRVADSDPFIAIQDTLSVFAADEIVISTLPPGRSNWLERGLIERARRNFAVPVIHEVSHYGVAAAA